MPDKVVDASVLGAVAFGETRAEEALSLIRGAQLHAPTLLAYELTSIARKKALQYPGQRDGLAQTLEAALAMEIRWTEVMHSAVLRLALETGLTTCDATYLYVARSLGLPLVTFDDRLKVAARGHGS